MRYLALRYLALRYLAFHHFASVLLAVGVAPGRTWQAEAKTGFVFEASRIRLASQTKPVCASPCQASPKAAPTANKTNAKWRNAKYRVLPFHCRRHCRRHPLRSSARQTLTTLPVGRQKGSSAEEEMRASRRAGSSTRGKDASFRHGNDTRLSLRG